jgi:hypothetical protein
MSRLSVAIATLIERWKQENVQLVPPGDNVTVQTALEGLVAPVAQDVVQLYCLTGGMADGDMDANHFCLWPLERVLSEHESSSLPNVEFADFLIESHRYALQAIDDETSAVCINYYSDEVLSPVVVSSSLSTFFEKYAAAGDEVSAFRVLHESP